MGVCSPNRFNFTIRWVMFEANEMKQFISREDDFIGGIYASYIAKEVFLNELEDIRRWKVCRFVWTNKTGDYDPTTGRYDGAIGLLVDGLADAFVRPMELGSIDFQYVSFCRVPFGTTAFSPAQLIKKKANQEVVQSLSSLGQLEQLFNFLVPSVGFLTFALIGCLLCWLISTLFAAFKKSASLPPRKSLQGKIISFFFILFLFFIQRCYEISLNTNNVVVRTDQLLYSKEQILQTKKEFCFWEKGSEVDFFKDAPMDSILHQIYEKRNATDPCFLVSGNQMGNIFQRPPDKIFALVPHLYLDFGTRMIQTFMMTHTYIEEALEIYQSTRSFIFWKGMQPAKRSFFEESMEDYVEFGFSTKYSRSTLPNFTGIKFAPRGEYLHFGSIQAYIEEHTSVIAIPFHKLDYLFRIYFALLTLALFANLAHYLLSRSLPQKYDPHLSRPASSSSTTEI